VVWLHFIFVYQTVLSLAATNTLLASFQMVELKIKDFHCKPCARFHYTKELHNGLSRKSSARENSSRLYVLKSISNSLCNKRRDATWALASILKGHNARQIMHTRSPSWSCRGFESKRAGCAPSHHLHTPRCKIYQHLHARLLLIYFANNKVLRPRMQILLWKKRIIAVELS
jgi:hypothetical protein